MNEQIRELCRDADLDVHRFWNDDESNRLEIFAQLIVRECIAKIENEAFQYSEPVWAVELVNDIKQHFGVE